MDFQQWVSMCCRSTRQSKSRRCSRFEDRRGGACARAVVAKERPTGGTTRTQSTEADLLHSIDPEHHKQLREIACGRLPGAHCTLDERLAFQCGKKQVGRSLGR